VSGGKKQPMLAKTVAGGAEKWSVRGGGAQATRETSKARGATLPEEASSA